MAEINEATFNSLEMVISAQPDWGKPVGNGRPLADSEIVPRLQAIKVQIGGSYAIDRAIEVLEELQERPKGEWILELDETDPDRSMRYVCSVCGGRCREVDEYVFCPYCGIGMKGK